MTIIYAAVLFALLIFPHELGHFIVAKAAGVKVNEFAFGMGPALFKKQGKETLYAIRLIPIGGYCAMEGEDEESESSRAFNNKPLPARLAVLFAGSAMNVLIAVLTLSIICGYIGSATTTIDQVEENSPAYEAGILSGDRILSVDGQEVKKWSQLTSLIGGKGGETVTVTCERDGKEQTFTLTPKEGEDGRYVIGITSAATHNPFTAVKNGAISTWNMTKLMGQSLVMLFTGQVSSDEISGPVGIISMAGDTARYGMLYFGYLLALISLNLAMINLLPLPALDGGRIIFAVIRKITGKMISDELEAKIHGAGMVLLLGFMLFVTWNDIARLFS